MPLKDVDVLEVHLEDRIIKNFFFSDKNTKEIFICPSDVPLKICLVFIKILYMSSSLLSFPIKYLLVS